jgi:ABC-type bacteriocin/lantibiotic exporter with double-glycine peptidase domain
MFTTLLRRVKPYAASTKIVRSNETLPGFVWRASGAHQFYVGLIAIAFALLNFVPIDLQRRVVDVAIENKDVKALLFLGGLYLVTVLLQAALKYVLMFYQGWVGDSAVKTSRDQLAKAAAERPVQDQTESGQTVNVIGNEIDGVGGFVGTSISEFVVNLTLLVVITAYMLYVEPVIAFVSAVSLVPQIWLALYMQAELNTLVGRQVGLVRKLGNETIAPIASNPKTRGRKFRTIRTIFNNRIQLYFLKYGLKTLLVIKGQTTIGTVVAFVSGFERLSGPLRDLLNFYREYSQAKVQYQMIVRWVEAGHAELDKQQGRTTYGTCQV